MKIETDYNVGDNVFFMQSNKICTNKISAIKIIYFKKNTKDSYEFTIHYRVDSGIFDERGDAYGTPLWLTDEKFFSTKKELLKSL